MLAACTAKKGPEGYIIANVNVVDVEKGAVLPRQWVLINGERIEQIAPAELKATKKLEVIDGTGKFLIPGLWDMHAHYHWNAEWSAPMLIANGVTGVREMFGDTRSVMELKDKCRNNLLCSPDLVAAGPIIDGFPPVWEGSDTITVPTVAPALVQKQIDEGAAFLKVYSLLDPASYKAIAAEARRQNIPFAGHLPLRVSIWQAIAEQQKSIEHMDGILEGSSRSPGLLKPFETREKWLSADRINTALRTFDEKRFDSLARTLARSNTWLCPTLTVLRSEARFGDPAFTKDNRLAYMPDTMIALWKTIWINDTTKSKAWNKAYEKLKSLTGRLQHAGVKLLAGTDFPNPYVFPGFSLHDELQLMTEGGLSPAEALRAATLNPAIYLEKLSDYGTIEKGKLASLVLLGANPLEQVSNTTLIEAVFLKGRYFDRENLGLLIKPNN